MGKRPEEAPEKEVAPSQCSDGSGGLCPAKEPPDGQQGWAKWLDPLQPLASL